MFCNVSILDLCRITVHSSLESLQTKMLELARAHNEVVPRDVCREAQRKQSSTWTKVAGLWSYSQPRVGTPRAFSSLRLRTLY
jgi:hypothetical protein